MVAQGADTAVIEQLLGMLKVLTDKGRVQGIAICPLPLPPPTDARDLILGSTLGPATIGPALKGPLPTTRGADLDLLGARCLLPEAVDLRHMRWTVLPSLASRPLSAADCQHIPADAGRTL